jgi:hypothetical protein
MNEGSLFPYAVRAFCQYDISKRQCTYVTATLNAVDAKAQRISCTVLVSSRQLTYDAYATVFESVPLLVGFFEQRRPDAKPKDSVDGYLR